MAADQANSSALSHGTLRPLIRLAFPVLVENLLHTALSFTDTYLAGQYLVEPRYMAAMTVMSYVMWLLPTLFGIVAIGATALVARAIGARDINGAQRITGQAFAAGAAVAVAIVLGCVTMADSFLEAMQLSPDAAELAARYVWIMIPVIPAMMLEEVGTACLRGAGDTVTGLIAMFFVDLVDGVTSYGFVTGAGPFPRLGWDGLAWGNFLGYLVGAAIITVAIARGRGGLRFSASAFRWNAPLQWRLWRIGLPGGIDVTAVVLCHLWFVSIITSLGLVQTGAHGAAIRIEALAYLPGNAFQVAVTTMVGQLLGAGQARRATRAALVGASLGLSFMSCGACLFYFAAEPLARFFLKDEATVQLSAQLLQIVAFGVPPLALMMTFTGALRGAGDTRWPLAITFVGLVGVRIPLAYVLALPTSALPGALAWVGGYDFGVPGAWYAMLIDLGVRCLLIVARFSTGAWKNIAV